MKKTALLLATMFCGLFSWASSIVSTPYVSGIWTTAGSPYLIYNSITVPVGNELTIEPGVEVIFQGYYSFSVLGKLNAIGIPTARITFRMNDTTSIGGLDTVGGWQGMGIGPAAYAATDTFVMAYCDIQDTKYHNLYGGGCFSARPRNTVIKYCNFFNNRRTGLIGVDSLQYLEFSHCGFYDNNAIEDSVCTRSLIVFGGNAAVMANAAKVNIHDCKIYNNIGGSNIMEFTKVNLTFNRNEVYNNRLYIHTYGAIANIQTSTASLTENIVHHNTTTHDAAISCLNSNADINRNLICNNTTVDGFNGSSACGAVQGGGGIRVAAEDGYEKYLIRNNVIANNYAGLAGGGIYVYRATVYITNNQIVNNTTNATEVSGNGIYAWNNGITAPKTTIVNNIFYNNIYGLDSSNLFIYGDSLEFHHNWSQHGFHYENYGFYPAYIMGDTLTNVIGTNPALVAPTLTYGTAEDAITANFGLLPTSTCINKGISSGSGYNDTIDFVANPRIYGSAIDIGAYEYKPAGAGVPSVPGMNETVIYPNPASTTLFFSLPEAKGTVALIDISGKQVHEIQVREKLISLNINHLARGTYLAIWYNGGTKETRKVIVE